MVFFLVKLYVRARLKYQVLHPLFSLQRGGRMQILSSSFNTDQDDFTD